MTGTGDMLLNPTTASEPSNEYNKEANTTNEIKWYQDALDRADNQIELQKELIDALKLIIEKQIKVAKDAGIEL